MSDDQEQQQRRLLSLEDWDSRRETVLEGLRALSGPVDEEAAHGEADRLLLALIDDQEITAAFDAIHKWYA